MPKNILHILDMYRTIILGSYPQSEIKKMMENKKTIGGEDIIRSATELHKAGIKIKKSTRGGLRDIRFDDGQLLLPMITIDDTTEPLYLNLIAYERSHVGAGKDVTSYTFFMDNIIDSIEDVQLLHSEDIIQNGIGSNKAAAELFNSLSKDISLDKASPLAATYNSVNVYSKRHMPKYRAELFQTYLKNPWVIISLPAGIILFVLTITQIIYSIKDFYKKD